MTVCLTGDVHHMSLETREQPYMSRSEAAAAVEYAEIAAEFDVPVTLFLTGKVVLEEPELVDRLIGMETVELGGHNYYAFETLAHKAFRGLLGSWNGPRRFQAWEIDRTIAAFNERQVDISAWRDHAYRHDNNTVPLLAERGFTHFSDVVGPGEQVRCESGLTVVPVNTPPDHEHVYHGFRTPKFVAEDEFSGPFGDESFTIEEWHEWVLKEIEVCHRKGQPATILAHPGCMDLSDELIIFKKLCSVLSEEYETVPISEVDSSD